MSDSSESEIETSNGGELSEESNDSGVGGVSGKAGAVFKSGNGRGVRGDRGRGSREEDSAHKLVVGTAVDREADCVSTKIDTMVKSWVTLRVTHERTESPEDRRVQRFASLNDGGKNSAVNGWIQFPRSGPNREPKKDTSTVKAQLLFQKKWKGALGHPTLTEVRTSRNKITS